MTKHLRLIMLSLLAMICLGGGIRKRVLHVLLRQKLMTVNQQM